MESRTIVVSRAMRQSIIDTYDEDHARQPTPTELKATIDNWVADEILYREGRAMGLDAGDPTIRDRVIYKLKSILTDDAKPKDPSEQTLVAWFAAHHDRFDQPEMFTFLATAPVAEDLARAEYEQVRAGREPPSLQDQTRVFLKRPRASIAPVFGESFATALERASIGQWQVVHSTAGWHLVRVDARISGAPARLDGIRDEVVTAYKAEQQTRATVEAIHRLQAQYTVRIDP
jgi:hypothetical protein